MAASADDADAQADVGFAGSLSECAVENAASNVAAEPAAKRARHKEPPQWACGPAMTAHVRRLREQVRCSTKQVVRETMFAKSAIPGRGWRVEPADPALGTESSPARFYIRPWGCWLPHVLFDEVPPCPFCKAPDHVDTARAFWPAEGPKRVLGLFCSWWLDTMRYTCAKCNRTFRGTHPDSLVQLSAFAQSCFGVSLGRRHAVDEELARFISDTWMRLSGAKVVDTIQRWHTEFYHHNMLLYFCRLAALAGRGRSAQVPHDAAQQLLPYVVSPLQKRHSKWRRK